MRHQILKLFFLFFLQKITYAQNGNIIGSIIDANTKQAIEFATITIKKDKDTSFIKGTKSKENGKFELNNISFGAYQITISSIGYGSKVLKNQVLNSAQLNTGVHELLMTGKQLKDVVITGQKADIEIAIDKKVFNVDKNITAEGGTAADILRNVPSVNVDMDGNLSLRGKSNITLLVDGKPSAMFGNDVATALQTIPAASIDQIEVIPNPSSKYEAQGMNGIINIILKKDKKAGFNGMFNMGVASPYRLNGGINMNLRKNKWNFFLNANGRTQRAWEQTNSIREDYENPNSYYSELYNKRRPLSGFGNIGAEYAINDYNKITLSQSVFNANMIGDSKNEIWQWYMDSVQVRKTERYNQYTGSPLNGTTNLQYKKTWKDKKDELNVELNFSKSRYKRKSDFQTTVIDSIGNSNYFAQKNPVLGGNWNGTFVIDYSKPLGKKWKLEAGERSYLIQFKSENQPTIQFNNQNETPENILKNHFVFYQQVHGVYTNLSTQIGKLALQGGLRGELFAYEGTAYQYNATAQDAYFNLFPTFFASYKMTSHDDINLSYSKRVNRPNFYQLIPFIDVTNPQDTSMGNPNLRPEFIHASEFSYSKQYNKNNTLLTSVYFQYTDGLIQRYRRFNDNGTTFSQNRNLASAYTYGLEITNKMNLLSWWDASVNINIFRNKINGANIDVSALRTGYGGFVKLISNAKLKYGFSTQITGNYFATTVIAQGEIKPYYHIDFAIKKSLFKNIATLTFNISDVFNTLETTTQYNIFPNYSQEVYRKNLTRIFGLNLQVRFADRKQLQQMDPSKMKTSPQMPSKKSEKNKEMKNRDENLKKDEGGDDSLPGERNRDSNK